jgi:hypothetical protein
VSVGQCAVACKAAPGCEMFTFNSVLQNCFLKAKQCPLRNNCQARLAWRPAALGSSVAACAATLCGRCPTLWRSFKGMPE